MGKGGIIGRPNDPTSTSAGGVWNLTEHYTAKKFDIWPFFMPGSETVYTTPGTYTWIAPAGVTSVSVVCVGGGGTASGGGGGLGWKNNIAVVPGSGYTVVVGAGAKDFTFNGANSYFLSTTTVRGTGGTSGPGGIGGNYAGDGGGIGGNGIGYGAPGGAGAGGYSGNGGNAGGTGSDANCTAGSGGGGGGGDTRSGGGVGIYGQGANGAKGTSLSPNGKGGSGGGDGSISYGGNGGLYGGGGDYGGGSGANGAVRIIWPGNIRLFPNTLTANNYLS